MGFIINTVRPSGCRSSELNVAVTVFLCAELHFCRVVLVGASGDGGQRDV